MPTIAEKRVFTQRDDVVQVLVASSMGVASVSLSGDIVGEFGIEHRCDARDVAARGDALAVATDDDVLVGEFAPTGHGPAVAVSVTDEEVLAVAPDGTVSTLSGEAAVGDAAGDDAPTGDAWTVVGTVEAPRRMDGRLLATADGVSRRTDDGLTYAGLDDVRDVSDRGVPLAVTDDALYTLGNGWMRDVDAPDGESFRCVVADADGDRALAATETTTYERADATATEWVDHGEADLVDAGFAGRHLVAVTEAGEARVYADGNWRGRTLGLPDVRAVAVPGE